MPFPVPKELAVIPQFLNQCRNIVFFTDGDPFE